MLHVCLWQRTSLLSTLKIETLPQWFEDVKQRRAEVHFTDKIMFCLLKLTRTILYSTRRLICGDIIVFRSVSKCV